MKSFFWWYKKHTVSTNNLLPYINLDSFIEINLEIDELDLTAAECKASYQENRQYIHDRGTPGTYLGVPLIHLNLSIFIQKIGAYFFLD